MGELGGAIESLTQAKLELQTGEDVKLEAQLGKESYRAVRWLEHLLTRAASVAKIHKDTDDTVGGTGFLVKRGDLDGSSDERMVLLTNHHVLNEAGTEGAIPRDKAMVQLTRYQTDQDLSLGRVLWSDPELDATVCEFEVPALAKSSSKIPLGLPVGRSGDLNRDEETPRMYVVGHPLGSPLQVSLYDNRLIDMDDTWVRYRSPTESGSSGSPVLTADLDVVAIHQATRRGQQANQGILLDRIRENFKKCLLK